MLALIKRKKLMRIILLIFFTLYYSTILRAEYNGYLIKFEVETLEGNKFFGYSYLSTSYFNLDSLENTNYLITALDPGRGDWEGDSLIYYKERIKYEYRHVGNVDGEKIPIYTLNNRQVILDKEIKNIDILEIINQTYMVGISSPLSISDTTWSNKDPIESYSFGAYLCFHQIYIHERSKNIKNIIARLQAKQKEIDEIEFDSEMGDQLDNEISKMIDELSLLDNKIVVITECSC